MASDQVLQPISLTPSQSYSPAKWEGKRPLITRLYRDEAKPLHAVRVILARDHDFRPTIAMMKKRVKKWSLDRKHKLPDMLVALRLGAEREAQGKKTLFVIREQVVPFEDVKYYFRRRGERDLKSLLHRADSALSTAPVRYRTPEPDSTASGMEDHRQGLLIDAGDSNPFPTESLKAIDAQTAIGVFAGSSVTPLLMPEAATRQVEQLLYLGRSYFDSVFENSALRSDWIFINIEPLQIFYREFSQGQQFLERGIHLRAAFKLFDRAFGRVYDLLKGQTLMFLPFLYYWMMQSKFLRRQEVIFQLLKFTAQMSHSLPEKYLMHRAVTLLSQLSVEHRAYSSDLALHSILDHKDLKLTFNTLRLLNRRNDEQFLDGHIEGLDLTRSTRCNHITGLIITRILNTTVSSVKGFGAQVHQCNELLYVVTVMSANQ